MQEIRKENSITITKQRNPFTKSVSETVWVLLIYISSYVQLISFDLHGEEIMAASRGGNRNLQSSATQI